MGLGISATTLYEAKQFAEGLLVVYNKDGTSVERPGFFRRFFLFAARFIGSVLFFGAFGLIAYDWIYLGLPFAVAALDGFVVLVVSAVFLHMEGLYTRAAAGIWLAAEGLWGRKRLDDGPESAFAPFQHLFVEERREAVAA